MTCASEGNQLVIGHRVFERNNSFEIVFRHHVYSHESQIHFHMKSFETEAQGNSEIAHSCQLPPPKFNDLLQSCSPGCKPRVTISLPQTVSLQNFDIASVSLESDPVLLHSTYDI